MVQQKFINQPWESMEKFGSVRTLLCRLLRTGNGNIPACIHSLSKRENNVSLKPVADLRGAPGTRPPLGVQILSFSCSFWQKNRLAHPLWELAPPQENPGSTTGNNHFSNYPLTVCSVDLFCIEQGMLYQLCVENSLAL